MRTSTLSRLCCPFCTSALRLKKVVDEDDVGVVFGLAACSECDARFPIVAGVLITSEPSERVNTVAARPRSRSPVGLKSLCWLIESGKQAEAMSRLLNPCAETANLLVRPARSFGNRNEPRDAAGEGAVVPPDPYRRLLVPSSTQRFLNEATGERLLRWSRRRVTRFFLDNLDELSAWDVMRLYYSEYSRSEMAYYFAYRFCQPRHLAALSLASVARNRGGPIVDLACGAGHLTHYFASGNCVPSVIGIDRHFFSLFLARNFVAPGADFICQGADQPLPLRSEFDSAFCSDAFYYFPYKAQCIREMRRVVGPEGVIVMPRFSDMTGEPRDRRELQTSGYHRLFGSMEHVFLTESRLIESYLNKKGPDLGHGEAEDTSHHRWWCVVAAESVDLFRDHAPFPQWPHSIGRLTLNPIYRKVGETPQGGIVLRLELPSKWYAYENRAYLDYAPELVEVPGDVLTSLASGARTAAVEDMIGRFVMIGLPRRYV